MTCCAASLASAAGCWLSGGNRRCHRRFSGRLRSSRRLILTPWRPSALLHLYLLSLCQPCRRASPALALAQRETFQAEDRFFELVSFLAQVAQDFPYVHSSTPVIKIPFRNNTRACSPRSGFGTSPRRTVRLDQLVTHWMQYAQGFCSISGTVFLYWYQNPAAQGEKAKAEAGLRTFFSSRDKRAIPIKSTQFRRWTRAADAPAC